MGSNLFMVVRTRGKDPRALLCLLPFSGKQAFKALLLLPPNEIGEKTGGIFCLEKSFTGENNLTSNG